MSEMAPPLLILDIDELSTMRNKSWLNHFFKWLRNHYFTQIQTLKGLKLYPLGSLDIYFDMDYAVLLCGLQNIKHFIF